MNNQKTRRGKGKPRMQGESKESKTFDKRKSVKDNDPSWYLVNGQLAKDVANFNYNNATGDPVSITNGKIFDAATTWKWSTFRLPGVATVLTGPSVGASYDSTSPINVAARNIYSFVRHANSGHANYDPADLMLYLLAVDSVQSFWSWMVRVYGVTQTFSQRNRYVGDALLRAMGVDPAIRKWLSEFRSYINQFAIKASVLAVPNTMSYYLRHAWMYQNVYTDEDNPKAQMFLFAPAYLYKYDLDEGEAGMLRVVPVCGITDANNDYFTVGISTLNIDQIRTIGDTLINAMLSQEDVGIMSGDILKAYGSDKLYRFNQIAEEYAVAPVFSEEVLGQFHNLSIVGRYPAKETDPKKFELGVEALDITQDTTIGNGNLIFKPSFAAALDLNYTQFLDSWKSDVTPEDSLVNSRLMTWLNVVGDKVYWGTTTFNVNPCRLSSCGSELVLDVIISTFNYEGTLYGINCRNQISTASPQQYNTLAWPYSTKFNQFPLMRQFNSDGTLLSVMGEMSNYTVINEQELAALHNTALLSMFGVPYNW